MSLTRKRKKELRRLQNDATDLWDTSRSSSATPPASLVKPVASSATSAASRFSLSFRTLTSALRADRGPQTQVRTPRRGRQGRPDRRRRRRQRALSVGCRQRQAPGADVSNGRVVKKKQGPGLGSIIAIVLGAAAAAGVLYTAWQALRTDDELWVADDPLSAPDA